MKFDHCRVAKLVAKEQMTVVEADIFCCNHIKKNEAVIRIEYVGICGSDVHFFALGDYLGDALPYPIELGHECAGTVVAVGSDVTNIKVGDRVALEPGKECGKCEFCRKGKYNLCPNMDFMAAPPTYRGAFTDYVKHPAHRCFVLPDNVSTLQGCLMEPMAVGFYAAERGRVAKGERVLIIGAGCIGLMAMFGCFNAGASEVIVADVIENRLEMAEKLGATRVINSKAKDHWEDVRADVVIECSGSSAAVKIASQAVKADGRLTMIGCSLSPVPVEFAQFCIKEIEIIPVYRYRHMYTKLIDVLKKGEVDISTIVSGIYEMENIQQAFSDALYNKTKVIKNVIRLIQ